MAFDITLPLLSLYHTQTILVGIFLNILFIGSLFHFFTPNLYTSSPHKQSEILVNKKLTF
jgi:hypothetical protein